MEMILKLRVTEPHQKDLVIELLNPLGGDEKIVFKTDQFNREFIEVSHICDIYRFKSILDILELNSLV